RVRLDRRVVPLDDARDAASDTPGPAALRTRRPDARCAWMVALPQDHRAGRTPRCDGWSPAGMGIRLEGIDGRRAYRRGGPRGARALAGPAPRCECPDPVR